jgi:hypothetical protein
MICGFQGFDGRSVDLGNAAQGVTGSGAGAMVWGTDVGAGSGKVTLSGRLAD